MWRKVIVCERRSLTENELGRYLTNQLGKHGTQVITAYRGDEDTARHLKIMGDLGQIVPLRFSLKEEQTIGQCMRNCNIVYNLIGRETETRYFNPIILQWSGSTRSATKYYQ